jgi:hypothetical protein
MVTGEDLPLGCAMSRTNKVPGQCDYGVCNYPFCVPSPSNEAQAEVVVTGEKEIIEYIMLYDTPRQNDPRRRFTYAQVETAIRLALRQQAAEVEALRHKLLMIVSHASGGSLQDIDLSTNDISVEISRHVSRVYEEGKKTGATKAEAALARMREALTPSADTKAAYIGEIKERVMQFDEDGEERWVDHTISWDATKATMKMIAEHAARQAREAQGA